MAKRGNKRGRAAELHGQFPQRSQHERQRPNAHQNQQQHMHPHHPPHAPNNFGRWNDQDHLQAGWRPPGFLPPAPPGAWGFPPHMNAQQFPAAGPPAPDPIALAAALFAAQAGFPCTIPPATHQPQWMAAAAALNISVDVAVHAWNAGKAPPQAGVLPQSAGQAADPIDPPHNNPMHSENTRPGPVPMPQKESTPEQRSPVVLQRGPQQQPQQPAEQQEPEHSSAMTFKEFLAQQDDSITPALAQENYQKYLKESIQAKTSSFFEAHKHEEWLRELYHPAWIAQRSARIRRETVTRAAQFAQNLEACGPDVVMRVLEAKSDQDAAESIPAPKKTTLFFRGVPAAVPRASLTDTFSLESKHPIAELRFGDVSWTNSQLTRFVWAVYETEKGAEAALDVLRDKTVDFKLLPPETAPGSGEVEEGFENKQETVQCKLDPVRNRDKRKRSHSLLPRMSTRPERLRYDAMQAEKVMRHMDEMRKLPAADNVLTPEFLKDLGSDRRRIDCCSANLLQVHLLCYYTGNNYIDDPSGVLASPCRPSEGLEVVELASDVEIPVIPAEDKSQWERKVDERMSVILATNSERMKSGILDTWDRRNEHVEEWIQTKTKTEGPERYRCLLPPFKLFRSPEFVRKHILSKHEADLNKFLREQDQTTYLENYLADQDHITDMKPSNRGNHGHGQGQGNQGAGSGHRQKGRDPRRGSGPRYRDLDAPTE